eukprot:1575781-Pyramimonas_sp.AAC.1
MRELLYARWSDLNDGLRYTPEGTACGQYSTGDEHGTTQMLRPLMDGMALTSYGTHFRMAPSYIGEHHSKTLDHIIGWQCMLGAVEEVRTLAKAGRRLQLHHTGRPFDHRPVQLTAHIHMIFEPRVDRAARPNQEAMHQ